LNHQFGAIICSTVRNSIKLLFSDEEIQYTELLLGGYFYYLECSLDSILPIWLKYI